MVTELPMSVPHNMFKVITLVFKCQPKLILLHQSHNHMPHKFPKHMQLNPMLHQFLKHTKLKLMHHKQHMLNHTLLFKAK